MNSDSKQKFLDVMDAMCRYYDDKQLPQGVLEIYWRLLEGRSTTDFVKACEAHMASSKFFPKVSELIEKMPPDPNKPMGAEQAWNEALRLRIWEEGETVICPKAIFNSFPFQIWPDKVAARMAFIEAYPGQVNEYGTDVFISMGHDINKRRTAIDEAVRRKLITVEQAQKRLPDYTPPDDALKLTDEQERNLSALQHLTGKMSGKKDDED